jgi:hypothetical protein
MRVAAWALIISSGLACAWFAAVWTMLIVPGGGRGLLDDPYYEVAAARGALLPAFLALLNGIGTWGVHRRRRPGALWLVLGAGLMLLGCAAWLYLSLHAPASIRLPRHAADFGVALQRESFFRWLLGLAGLGLTIVGWLSWRVNQRITFNLERG